MVIRGGGGIFYQRFGENNTLQQERFNGINQQQFVVPEPFTNGAPPTLAQIAASRAVYDLLNTFQCTTGGPTNCVATKPSIAGFNPQQQAIYRVASNIQAPAMYLVGTQVERQMPKNITVYAGLSMVRMLHQTRLRDINAPLPGTITALTPQGTRPNPALGDVNQYESSATTHQTQLGIGFNSRLNPNLSFSGNYSLAKVNSNGEFFPTFPVNSYDMSSEWGRGSNDIRHRFNLLGTYSNPKLWKLSFNPLISINSGGPFNITTGTDTNLDCQFNERPTFAQLNAYCTVRADRCTSFDYSRTDNVIIPRNYGHAPGSVSVNLRVSRTFSWGGEARSAANRQQQNQQGKGPGGGGDTGNAKRAANNTTMIGGGMSGGMRGGGPGGPGGGGPGGGGPQVMMMGGPGGGGGPAKYNLTLSVQFQNILNHVNFSAPVGNLTSGSFGQSLSTGGFGGFGGGGDSGPNRKIFLNARFTF